MVCTIHPNKQASSTCEICGQPFCEECLVDVDGKFYCKEHVAMLINPTPAPHRTYYNPHGPQDSYNQGYNAPPQNINIYNGSYNSGHYGPGPGYYPYKNRIIALLLCIFLGAGGIHRFYVGKIGTGLLYLFTGGLFGIGWIVDIICLNFGSFRDRNGFPLV